MNEKKLHCPLCGAFGTSLRFESNGSWKCLSCPAQFRKGKVYWKGERLSTHTISKIRMNASKSSGGLQERLDALENLMEEVLKEQHKERGSWQVIVSIVTFVSASILIITRVYDFLSNNRPFDEIGELLFVIALFIVALLIVSFVVNKFVGKGKKREAGSPNPGEEPTEPGKEPALLDKIVLLVSAVVVFFNCIYKKIKLFVVNNRLKVVVLSILIIFLTMTFLLTMNNRSYDAASFLHVDRILPGQTGLSGYESVYVEISVMPSGFRWGLQSINFVFHPANNEYVRLRYDERARVFSYLFLGNRQIALFSDYYFNPNRSYILKIFVNDDPEPLKVLPLHTRSD